MKKELNQARLRLMFLYLGVGSLLVILIGTLAYGLINHFLLLSVDGMLKQRMALLYQANSVPVPSELSSELDEKEKSSNYVNGRNAPSVERDDQFNWITSVDDEHAYANGLAGIFILPLDINGNQLSNPNPFAPPIKADSDASQAALRNGSDLRTIRTSTGIPYRLLSYRMMGGGAAAVVQMGKSISDQENISSQFQLGLIIIGAAGVAGLGLASWWLSGRALQPALQAWEQQQSFIANAGHELRTPLTLIRSGMEIVQRTGLNQDQNQLIGDALAECDHMNKLVEDLLLLSRLDHQRLSFEFSSVELQPLVIEVCRKMEPLATRKEITIHTEVPNGEVYGDSLRLRQVLLILLDNAIRNTGSGGRVEIVSRLKQNQYEIQVSDSGVGIPGEDLKHIFERFYRVNRSTDKDYSGNGLGLSIAKTIIEAHHGTIRINSEVGKGTTVLFTLPIYKKT
jgi:signal transduction histidine kinase